MLQLGLQGVSLALPRCDAVQQCLHGRSLDHHRRETLQLRLEPAEGLRLSRPLMTGFTCISTLPALPYGEISGGMIDADARPLARPRPVAIPLPFHGAIPGDSEVFGGEWPVGLRARESV